MKTRTLFGILCSILCVDLSDCSGSETVWPNRDWTRAAPADVAMNVGQLARARDYALTGGGSGVITRHGKLVLSWGNPGTRYDLKSTTKSIGVTALGLALADGRIRLADKVIRHHPTFAVPPESNRQKGWPGDITIQQLATQTAGFEKPGGYTKLIFEPGTKWSYSDGGPNWLAECVTLAYRRDLNELMFDRVFTPIGIDRQDLVWRRNSYRSKDIDGIPRREFGSGISANVDAMARIGYLYLRKGDWNGRQIIPEKFVAAASTTVKSVVGLPEVDPENYGNASDHYGLLWWNNADGTLPNVPSDAYWSWGLYDSLIVVIPSLDIVVARAGKSWKRSWNGHYQVLQPFLDPLVASVRDTASAVRESAVPAKSQDRRSPVDNKPISAPKDLQADDSTQADDLHGAACPPSPVIKAVHWAPASTILRRAKGSDNWPMTWGDDDARYTAYGDGYGFEPFVERKLSMGLCKVTGEPGRFQGVNLRALTAERTGGGATGPKVSGIVMVDGVLYMLVRNTGNSQLAWSSDHGRTWEWSDWKFETSFGYPTFLNFGRDYDGARDEFVYIYSHDSNTAYRRSDHMVMARVPRDRIQDRRAYEFLAEASKVSPIWSKDIDRRGAVFTREGNCYRSSVSYHAGSRRYLWCQTGAGTDTRFRGGLAIYDAPEPWGPWTTAFYAAEWDVGPGETSCLPTKWMSTDGRSAHLVFSGNDSFSVRKCTLTLAQ